MATPSSAAASSHSDLAAQEGRGIDALAAAEELEVQVLAGREAGLSHVAEAVAGGDAVARADADRPAFEVVVARAESAAVVELDEVALGAVSVEARDAVARLRDDARERRGEGGFGLGLAIAKSLVESQGGTITAASSERDGTTFTVLL